MRIGELARELGVTPHAVRFYEKAGWLPQPGRAENGYREYQAEDLDHLRLLVDLRRLDLPLDSAARLASWCHSGHCEQTSAALPEQLAERRSDIASRIAGLRELDARLASLEQHLVAGQLRFAGELPMLAADAGPCCSAAAAVGEVSAGCACCATALG
jgi:MerR family copper efflux transcriptional regulator/MerR family gold-responsive transcriptional activator of gol and ges genes